MAFDVEGARKAGYNDEEIANFLGKQSNFDVLGANKAGYGYGDIVKHLVSQPPKTEAKPAVPAPAQKQVAEPEEGDFMRGLGNLPGQLQETYGGAKTLVGVLTKSKDLIQSGLESMEEGKFKQTSKQSDSFTEAYKEGIGTVLTDWLPYQIGSGVGSIAETGAFMLAGAAAGAVTGAGVGALPGALAGAISKTLIKQGIKDAAEEIAKKSGKEAAQKYIEAQAKKVIISAGTTAGMVSQAGMSGAGEVTGRAVEEAQKAGKTAEDIDLGRVVPAAIAHSVADFLINKTGINALKIGEKSFNNLALDIATRIAVTGAKQTPAELVQTAAERYGAKLSLTDAEALTEYVDTAAAAFGMSVAPGGVGGARTNLSQKFAKAAKEDTTPEDQLRLESTSAAGRVQAPPPPPNADLVAGLTPSMMGNVSMAKVSEDTTKAGEVVQANEAARIKPAEDLLAKADAGEQVKRGDIHAAAKLAGIASFPADIKSNQAKIDYLRNYLAQQGAPDAAGIDTRAGGAGPGVATLANQSQTATGAVGSESRGVVSTGTNAGTNLDGAVQQSSALSPVAQKVITQEFNDGATIAELVTKYGTTPELAASIDTLVKSLSPQGTLSGTTTSQAKQTTAQGQTASTAGTTVKPQLPVAKANEPAMKVQDGTKQPVPMSALTTPEALKRAGEVLSVPDKTPERILYELNKVNSRGGLATWEVETILGLRDQNQTTTQGQTTTVTPKTLADLSSDMQAEVARRQAEIAKIENSGRDATTEKNQLNKFLTKLGVTGTLSAKRDIKKDFLDEGELPYAVEGEEKSDTALAQERVKAYEESLTDEKGKPRTIPDYEISEEDQQLYNEMRDEINPRVKAANERRDELVAANKAALEAYRQAKTDAEQEAAFNRLSEIEDQLQEHGPEQRELPEYTKKFAADYKDIYFGNITAGPLVDGKITFGSSKREHQQAAAALQAYLQKTGGSHKEKLTAPERRAVNQYEEGRSDYSKIFGVEFPAWSKLTQEQKDIFLKGVPTLAGAQQTVAFAKLARQLNEDNSLLSEGEKREKQNTIDRQEKVRRESEEQQERDRQNREYIDRTKGGNNFLPNSVIKMIMDGNLRGVLEYMTDVRLGASASPAKRVMKMVAGALSDLNLDTKIEIVESSKIGGDLAQYDPAKDVIYVTVEGLTSNTILHEIVHAGTVKVINEYLYGKKGSLSQLQLNGIRQLERIMNETRGSLAEDHPDAYKNLFEFVSYALTSEQLQQDLHGEADVSKLESRLFGTEITKTNLPEKKSQWSKFKLAVANLLKVRDIYLTKSGNLSKAVQPNYVMEIAAAFDDIISKPTEPIFLPALPATTPTGKAGAATPATPPVPKPIEKHKAELGKHNPAYDLPQDDAPVSVATRIYRSWNNINTWRNAARLFQDDRYRIKAHDRILEMSDKLIREGKDKMNNVYEQIVLAVGDGKNFFNAYVSEPARELDRSVKEFADGAKLSTKKAIEELHKILEAVHEPERRMVRYLLSVPLSTKDALMHGGKKISAATRRSDILKLLDNYSLTQAQAKQLREELETIVFEKDASGNLVLDTDGNPKPNMKFVDPAGDTYTPRKPKGKFLKPDIKYDSDSYTATGINLADAKLIREQIKTHPQAAEIQKVVDSIQALHTVTTELNKIANYWSQPVSNRVAFYGFENYIPLKGPAHSTVDDEIDFERLGKGRELQDAPGAMGGRSSVARNPILQTMTDATRASLRAGRRNLTQAIKNAITNKDANGNTVLAGKISHHISFEDRNTVDLGELKGENSIFHYNDDGSIDVLVVQDENLRNSIRRTYERINPVVEFANKWTSRIGQMHTRYNYNFAPLNFVRDALTNTWNIGASELGPVEAARYLKDVAFLTANGGMYKAMQVAILFPKGDTQSLRALKTLAEKDPYIKDMVEYIRQGGMVSHLNGMSLQSNFQELNRNVGQSGIITNLEDLNQFVDVWTNMFELASRASAYSIAKRRFVQRGESEESAKTHAAVFTKNLANFEQVGEFGKAMGAFYMFFRPAATGAVRAVEAVAPAFTSLKAAEARLPPEIAKDEPAKEAYLKNYKELQRNARIMSGALFGLGMLAYTMAYMTSDDDDLGRNAVATDNMEQWTRFARFHVPRGISEAMGLKEPLIFQIPWGFGLGAFAAAGAQIAGVVGGSQKITEALPNIFASIMLDSFVPIPVSRIPISDPTNIPFWLLDTAAPSIARPILEFAMNVNGLGHNINSAAQRRLGDAYTGGDNIPEMWKDAAVWAHDTTDGWFDVSPNTMYFLSNSYIDGISRIGESLYGLTDVTQGRKDFNPKTDLPLLGSFFGARASYDSRQFAKVEKEVKHMEKVINDFKTQPVKYAEYTAKYPMDEVIVETYNKILNKELNPLRAQDKSVRLDKNLSPAERKDLLRMNQLYENLIKRQMIDLFDSYGLEP